MAEEAEMDVDQDEVDDEELMDGGEVLAALTPLPELARTKAVQATSYDIIPTAMAVTPCPIYSVATTKNMKWMFTGGDDGFIRKYDFMGSMNGIQSLTGTQKHGLVDSIQKAGSMASAWELEEVPESVPINPLGGLPTQPTVPKISPVYSMQVHSEAHFLLAGCESGNINLYSVRNDEGVCQHVLRTHDKPVSVLSLSGDERSVLSGSWDRKVVRWDLDTGAIVRNFTSFNSHITAIKFRPTGTEGLYHSPPAVDDVAFVLSFDGKGSIVDHRVPNGVVKTVVAESGVPPWGLSASWSPDGKRVYIGRRNGSNFRLPRDSGPVTSVLCMPNGRHVLCASFDNIRLWDLSYSAPEPVAEGGSVGGGASASVAGLPDFDLGHPIVPFSIIAGHHGGTISAMSLDWSSRYLITVSGNRGWDGTSTNQCLLHNVSSNQ
ncbi:WD40-repeat-containing domain protein [Obelidium mucronatum]|nr:WD40-repeat-containing domain protein [Obelidium mucronatum]